MRDPIRIVATLYLAAPSQTLYPIDTLVHYQIKNDDKTVHIQTDQLELNGEYQNEELLLWGHGSPDNWKQWCRDLATLFSQDGIESYQVDLFEEDGRLITRIAG